MEAIEKIKKALISIQRKNPFFTYLSLYLKFKEDKKGLLPEWAGAGVNIKGELTYKKEYVESLSDDVVLSLVLHELLHLSLLHLTRGKNKDVTRRNLSADVVVNQVLKDNGFSVPKDWIVSDNDNKIILFNKEIKDCNKKTFEEIYSEIEIPKQHQKQIVMMFRQKGEGQGNQEQNNQEQESQDKEGNGNNQGKGKPKDKNEDKQKQGKGKNEIPEELKGKFDYHFEADAEIDEKEAKRMEKEWMKRTQEALVMAKMRGDVPEGIERLFGELHKEQVNWKALLQRFIMRQIPYDFSWDMPNKKSSSIGIYMPRVLKERIKISVAVDLSGSIGQQEMTDFLSEIIGIAKAFRNRIEFNLITHETEVNDNYKIENGNIEKIKKLKLHGGGGTAHTPVFNYIKEKIKWNKATIFFTDGFSDLNEIDFERYNFQKIFLISKNGSEEQLKGKKCLTIKLRE